MILTASLLLLATATSEPPSAAPTRPPSHAVYTDVDAEVGTDRRSYGPGEPILLWIRLRHRWEPVTGATVSARVGTPGSSLGSILDPEDGDVADGPSELSLYDDGTHGDRAAGDGVYTARFTDTEEPGTYRFQVTAEGTTPDGHGFSLSRSLTRYVAVRVEAAQGVTVEAAEPISDAVREWVLRFRPQDRFGRYLGPGYADRIQVDVSGGTQVEPVEDQQNGFYTVHVRQLERDRAPVVKVRIPEQDMYLRIVPETLGPDTAAPRAPTPPPRPAGTIELLGGSTRLTGSADVVVPIGLGARMALPLSPRLRLEIEAATGTTEENAQGVRSRTLQGLAGLRLDVPLADVLVPFLTAGGGAVRVPGATNDVVPAVHVGGGVSLWPAPRLGLRATVRYLTVWDGGALDPRSDGSQLQLGLVLRP